MFQHEHDNDMLIYRGSFIAVQVNKSSPSNHPSSLCICMLLRSCSRRNTTDNQNFIIIPIDENLDTVFVKRLSK